LNPAAALTLAAVLAVVVAALALATGTAMARAPKAAAAATARLRVNIPVHLLLPGGDVAARHLVVGFGPTFVCFVIKRTTKLFVSFLNGSGLITPGLGGDPRE
jgi:hypothetical protein